MPLDVKQQGKKMILKSKLRKGRIEALKHLERVAQGGRKHQRPPLWLGAEYMIMRPFRFGDTAQFTFVDAPHDAIREMSRGIVDRAA